MSSVLSCGVIVTDGRVLLLGHTTGQAHWDLPKGKADPGEPALQAAIRELGEETGLVARPDQLRGLGRVPYRPRKALALFRWEVTTLPPLETLHCRVLPGRRRPEFDRYAYVSWADLHQYVQPRLWQAIAMVVPLPGALSTPDPTRGRRPSRTLQADPRTERDRARGARQTPG